MSGVRKYSLNENFFETIDIGVKAYWVGFLAADGYLDRNRARVHLSQAIKDINVLEVFKKHLEANHPVHDRETRSNGKRHLSGKISITSEKLYLDLISKGVVPRKSLILEPPIGVPNSLVNHWIRGYFDGDGSVFIRRSRPRQKRISITGTLRVLKFIQDKLGGLGYIHDIRPRAQVHRFQIGKREDIKRFADYIYGDATVFLERKRKIFDLILSEEVT